MDIFNFCKKKSSPLTKLKKAINENNIQELKEVLESGLDPDTEIKAAKGNYTCALHLAAKNGHVLCVQTLLEYGADREKTIGNWTTLRIALKRNQTEIAEFLLRVIKDINFLDPVCLSDGLWSSPFDSSISLLVRATPDLMKCRSNFRSDFFLCCQKGSSYGPLQVMAVSGYKFSQAEKKSFLTTDPDQDRIMLLLANDPLPERHMLFHGWLDNFQKQPQRLLHYCRLAIRRSFYGNCNVFYGVDQLKIPQLLKSYITINDVTDINTRDGTSIDFLTLPPPPSIYLVL